MADHDDTLIPVRRALPLADSPGALFGKREPRRTFEADEEVMTAAPADPLLGRPFPERGLLVVAFGRGRYAVAEVVEEERFALAVFARPAAARAFALSKPRATDGSRPRLRAEAIERVTLEEARLVARVRRLAGLALMDDPQEPVFHWIR